MAQSDLSAVLRYLQRLGTPGDNLADAEFLRKFVTHHDEAAFTELLKRHGPMVWTTCRRLLTQSADVDDAFQATFLVLIRRASSLQRPEQLGPWLHGVACRVAVRLRRTAARHRECPLPPEELSARESAQPDLVWTDLRSVLDEEVNRLPERYRLPFIMCFFQGLTNEETAPTGSSQGDGPVSARTGS